jgi:tetratricopeptide (TPR) repeat protein
MVVALLLLALLPVSLWLRATHRVNEERRSIDLALARFDLEDAAVHLDNYLKARPDDADAWFLAARTARRLQRINEATTYLEKAQQLSGVTEATRLEWDLLRVQQGDLGEIDVRLRDSIAPDYPDALLVLEALARGYIQIGRLADAREACDLWIARQPDHPLPWFLRGMIHERLGYPAKALPDYQRAVQNAPDDRDARLRLASVLLDARHTDAAAEQYESILAHRPDDSAAKIGLAECRIGQGHSAEAIPLLDSVLAREPTVPRALCLRGRVALEQDQLERAEQLLRQAQQLSPDDSEAMYQLSQTLIRLHKEEEARKITQRLDQLQKDGKRLEELTRIIASKFDVAQLRSEAGVIALRMGRDEEGIRWLTSSLMLKGDHRSTHAALADYYQKKGDLDRASTHRRLAESP